MPLARRVPKRGFFNGAFKKDYAIVNLDDLDAGFEAGAVVDEAALRAKGLVKGYNHDGIKILGDGDADQGAGGPRHQVQRVGRRQDRRRRRQGRRRRLQPPADRPPSSLSRRLDARTVPPAPGDRPPGVLWRAAGRVSQIGLSRRVASAPASAPRSAASTADSRPGRRSHVDKLLTIFKVPELRRKILFTAMLLAIYRIGFYIPLPIVDQAQLQNWEEQQSTNTAGKLFGTVAMFGGTSIGMSTIFGLGIMPYISASIIFQLLAASSRRSRR